MNQRLARCGTIAAVAMMAVAVQTGSAPLASGAAAAGPSIVKLVKAGDGWQLTRDGKPYVIKGAGGSADKTLLKNAGANSFRTWGADGLTGQLDEAQRLGLSVTIGIWLGHKEHGFDWHNAKMVADQMDRARQNVMQYRNHPALLIWALGNEMETNGVGDDPALWMGINDLAVMVHQLDPNHPTMTVIAEIGGNNVANINKYCPAIDIIGINSYAGAQSLPERYKKAGGTKPYVVTEYGPPGTWEFWKKTPWGAMDELTSTEKVEWYKKPYEANVIANSKMCLGAYAFTWGSKQEASATWYGMLLPDGSKLNAVDGMTEEWSGKPPATKSPAVEPLTIDGPREMDPNTTVTVHLKATDPQGDPLKVRWILTGEPKSYDTGGATEAAPPTFPEAIVESDNDHAKLKIPGGGRYRLFAYVHNNHAGAAMANLALLVKGPAVDLPAPKLTLPAVVYDEAGHEGRPWTPSGYMGNTAAIKMDDASTDHPHSGKTCLKVQYTAADNWGGVVWQDPANDWGTKQGGYSLAGAKRLSFWARGEKGGEVVSFSYGLLDAKAKFHDSDRGALNDVKLTPAWKQYTIDVDGKDLTRIKTGFVWTTAATGAPVTFFLDDIQWDKGGATIAGGGDTLGGGTGGDALGGGNAGGNLPNAGTTGTAAIPTLPKSTLPVVVYDEADRQNIPWTPSGYMGSAAAIKMDDAWTDHPHTGKTSLKVQYTANDNWGGVVWQDPANDWGTQPGGHNLTGAKKLTFWARGDKGGEVVSFSFGLLDAKAKYHDTGKGSLKDVKLTTDWTQYSIDLDGQDMSLIKTGFCWIVGGQGAPITFYLDDVRFE
ncbi:MAG: hypothetical protein M3Y56_10755 [Armatimonadota bacterium]|nr:hypothetical protein [Armatimonadota bacterium]